MKKKDSELNTFFKQAKKFKPKFNLSPEEMDNLNEEIEIEKKF